jgi:serine phosphatase RsbU (regulator of sigma subunit)
LVHIAPRNCSFFHFKDWYTSFAVKNKKVAGEVGGDYYDFLKLGEDRLGVVIADIAGKGIAAALLMANLQANLRSPCDIALDEPMRALKSVNRLFYQNATEGAYATLFFAQYEGKMRRLRYVNCGHLSAHATAR